MAKEKAEAKQSEPQEEPEVPTAKTYVFKSKYKRDQVTLQKTLRDKTADGSPIIRPGFTAIFERNTWTTRDPVRAAELRAAIKQRLQDGNPLHIVETTDLSKEGKQE